ncbi:sugar transferase [Modicisalibacter muralis]|nr:sugar transferase [Halomonas muralis]
MGGAKLGEATHAREVHHPLLEHQRRHSRPFERILINNNFHLVLGWFFSIILPVMVIWGWEFWDSIGPEQWAAIIGCSSAYLMATVSVQQLAGLPHVKSYVLVTPCVTLYYFFLLVALQTFAVEYDHLYVLITYLVGCASSFIICLAISVFSQKILAIVPFGKAAELYESQGAGWCLLDVPSLDHVRVNGVVADLQADLSDIWRRFLADCTIHRIPVYSSSKAMEMTCGKLSLDHLHEEVQHGSLSPHEGYEALKRGMDILAVLLVIPLVLPLMAMTMAAIRLDSPGPAIFKQRRMGFCCRQFTVYKFRSMYTGCIGKGFTIDGEDPRVTRVGRVIRKYRLDELPQLFNVLKGDMSLIGPRPESMELTGWYAKDVPYFHYRHVVRPGISGWAQVMQGYAADVDGMIGKLEYDFYYIKNFSFWLDVLIIIRTLKTLVTGFGSR